MGLVSLLAEQNAFVGGKCPLHSLGQEKEHDIQVLDGNEVMSVADLTGEVASTSDNGLFGPYTKNTT